MVTSIQQERAMLIYAMEQRSHVMEQRSHVSFDSFVHSLNKATKPSPHKSETVAVTQIQTVRRSWSFIHSISESPIQIAWHGLSPGSPTAWPLRTGASLPLCINKSYRQYNGQVTNHGTNIELVGQVKGGEIGEPQ